MAVNVDIYGVGGVRMACTWIQQHFVLMEFSRAFCTERENPKVRLPNEMGKNTHLIIHPIACFRRLRARRPQFGGQWRANYCHLIWFWWAIWPRWCPVRASCGQLTRSLSRFLRACKLACWAVICSAYVNSTKRICPFFHLLFFYYCHQTYDMLWLFHFVIVHTCCCCCCGFQSFNLIISLLVWL